MTLFATLAWEPGRRLARAGRIDESLAERLRRMVGYRSIAMHDYQQLQLAITIAVVERHLDDFLAYAQAVLRCESRRG